MRENDKSKKNGYDLMQDTQYLLLGVDETESSSFDLAEILAEFGSEESIYKKPADPIPPVQAPQIEKREAEKSPKIIAFPGNSVPAEPEETVVLPSAGEAGDTFFTEVFSPAENAKLHESEHPEPEEFPVLQEEPEEEFTEPRPLTMEDIVASTVDAVKAENERDQSEQRRRIEKARKKREKKRREPRSGRTLPEVTEEPQPKELAAFHKRRYLGCKNRIVFAVAVLLLLWGPGILSEMGAEVPFLQEGDNSTVWTVVFHSVLGVLCAPLFIAAVEELRERCCTFYTYTVLVNLVTLLDEVTMLVLPGRSQAVPLGGVAGCAMVFALWGLKNYHLGMWETFRTAAMGRPTSVVDCCASGVAKGIASSEGFVTRATMESTASQWQRLFLPVLSAASLVFAVLSSVGQQRGHDVFWCWSVVLCASCSFVCPLAYCVPFGRIARRLSRSGAAVAGQYGASTLSASAKLVVTDVDLFPRAAVLLNGLKLYGEERNHAISYAATLAVQGGGCLARVFETVCQGEQIPYQPLEHFHIHDDNGLSGMIRGETVLVGTPMFMRHKAVRLPATLPAKTAVCLAVDGELVAVFALKYSAHPPVEIAMRALGRNGLSLVLATRDGNVTAKLLKSRFGADGKAVRADAMENLNLSDPQREGGSPNGLLYREGLLSYVELVALSRRLCQIVRVGNLLSVLGSIVGSLLSFYLCFAGSVAVLTPAMLVTFLLLWVVPVFPLLIGVDRI